MKYYGVSTIRAWNSITPDKVIYVHRANYGLVKSILFNLYLFEGMSRKDASLLSSKDTCRSGFYKLGVKKSVRYVPPVIWEEVDPDDFSIIKSKDLHGTEETGRKVL